MDNPDLTEVVQDAVDDSALDASLATHTETEVDTTSVDLSADTTTETETAETNVPDPTVDPLAPVQDEFEKRWGIPAKSVTGRENRIPHSRVKTMVTKADQEGYTRAVKELEGKTTPQLVEFQTKVKDYEGRLEKVGQFEHILENDPKQFLSILSQIPAYKEFFNYISKLSQSQEPEQPQNLIDHSDMPQPDQTLSDGSKVYSLEGLAQRDEWLAKKIEDRAVRQAEERFSQRLRPIEEERQIQQRHAQSITAVDRQIADARKWAHFTELEPEIIKILNADPQISLERAYVKAFQDVQVPKVSADRNKIRTEVLQELRQKPISSSAPTAAVRPGSRPSTESRSLDDIIAQASRDAGLV